MASIPWVTLRYDPITTCVLQTVKFTTGRFTDLYVDNVYPNTGTGIAVFGDVFIDAGKNLITDTIQDIGGSGIGFITTGITVQAGAILNVDEVNTNVIRERTLGGGTGFPNNVLFQSDLELTGILQDDTQTKLLVLDSVTDVMEFRNVSSLPVVNPFDQDLNRADLVRFQRVDVYNPATDDRVDITTDATGTQYRSSSTVFTGPKEINLSHTSNDDTVTFKFENRSITAGTDAQLNIDADDDAYISFTDDGISNKYHIGYNAGVDQFRIVHGNNAMDSTTALYVDAAENVWVSKLKIGTVLEDFVPSTKMLMWDDRFGEGGVKWKDISTLPALNPFDQDLNKANEVEFSQIAIDGTNLLIDTSSDSFAEFYQTPVVTTGFKQFTFSSDTSDSNVAINIRNRNANANAHSSVLLQTDIDALAGDGGNSFITYHSSNLGGWVAGKQKSTNTYRWNYSAGTSDFLTIDANTKMLLENTGALTITAALTSSPADTILDSYVGTISDTGVLNKAIRTAYSATNDQTLSTTVISVVGTYYTVNSGGWGTAYNQFTGDWTAAAGPNITYSGTRDGIVTISGNMVFTASNNDIVELAIYQNASRRVGSRTVIINGNESTLSVQVNIALVVGDVITLKVANHTTTTDVISRSGWMNIVSV